MTAAAERRMEEAIDGGDTMEWTPSDWQTALERMSESIRNFNFPNLLSQARWHHEFVENTDLPEPNNQPRQDRRYLRGRTPRQEDDGGRGRVSIRFSEELYELLSNQYRQRDRIVQYLLDEQWRLDTSRINHLGLSGGKLSYLPADRPLMRLPDQSWSETGRQSGRAARVIRMVIPKEDHAKFSDADYERFSNLIKSTDVTKRVLFRMVEGTDIKRWYGGDTYSYGSGSLEASCMRHDHCQGYFSIYTENADIVKMLCMFDTGDDTLRGRALVWFVPGFDTPIMDRVYGNDTTKAMFRQYAAKHGWYYRAFNSYDREMIFVKDDETVYLDICVQLPNYRYSDYPYLDTMKFFSWTTGMFTNNKRRPSDYVLMDTHGEGAPMKWWQIIHREEQGQNFVKVLTDAEFREIEDWYAGPSSTRGEMTAPDDFAPREAYNGIARRHAPRPPTINDIFVEPDVDDDFDAEDEHWHDPPTPIIPWSADEVFDDADPEPLPENQQDRYPPGWLRYGAHPAPITVATTDGYSHTFTAHAWRAEIPDTEA